ncbi:TPA: poly-gamma-glutamate hydrolase family protein [Escherichia coli]|nr:poly-gamma-glutamate hydrolase family protein [Escherichia coli]
MKNDIYSCFKELNETEREDSYNIICEKEGRSDLYAIMAPHGGKIESGTTEISVAIAREDLSLYIFNANKTNNNRALHITSARFDELQCESMLGKVETVLAIHGARDPEKEPKERVWVGGSLREKFVIHLDATLSPLGILVEIIPEFLGKDPNNICNRGISKEGMQLEITKSLRDTLKIDKKRMEEFSEAVRAAMMLTYPSS